MTQNEATITISRESLKSILRLHIDATGLLEQIPKMQDEGRLSEVSQHIGAELEARVTEMNEAEKQDYIIKELLEEISNDEIKKDTNSLEELENEILGGRQ